MEEWYCPSCAKKQKDDITGSEKVENSNKKSEGKRCFKFMRFLSMLLSLRNNICKYRNSNIDSIQTG